jgi:hypothetical protein
MSDRAIASACLLAIAAAVWGVVRLVSWLFG